MLEAPDTREGVDTEDEGMEGVSGSNRWVGQGLGGHCLWPRVGVGYGCYHMM